MGRFAEVLKNTRLINGDSLRSAGNKTGLVFTYIDKIEKNERPINKESFEKILKAYPDNERELTQAYIEEVMPESIITKILKDINLLAKKGTDSELIEYLFNISSTENKKSALELILLQLEVEARKKGTYAENKEEFENLKKRIEKIG